MKPRIAVTVGDPRGIGPEIVTAALSDAALSDSCNFVVIGPEGLAVRPDVSVGDWDAGRSDAAVEAGRLSGLAIERAVALAQAGEVDGIVTAPIDKFALAAGGYPFPGHTEMLAELTGADTAMMLASDKLRVVLATTHIPLAAVVPNLSSELIVRVAGLARSSLVTLLGIASPRIALCAVNPHAGDSGRFGREDDEILRPAARLAGIQGPFPADTVFVRAMRGEFDVVIAPYHDVGMTAIKVASFGSAVNITLGLPFPRCSPDHGTALDIAGKGIADPASMKRAIATCAELVRRRG